MSFKPGGGALRALLLGLRLLVVLGVEHHRLALLEDDLLGDDDLARRLARGTETFKIRVKLVAMKEGLGGLSAMAKLETRRGGGQKL